MGKILLNNIAEELASKSGLTRDAADNFMRAFVVTIEKGLQEDSIVKVKGLGTFKLLEVSDRDSVNVNTGERITIKGHRKVTFTPDTAMKELVNRPFAHFEPTELSDSYPTEEESIVSETQSDESDEMETSTETPIIETIVEETSVEETTHTIEEQEEITEEITEVATLETPESSEATEVTEEIITETPAAEAVVEKFVATETAEPNEVTEVAEPTGTPEAKTEEEQPAEEKTKPAEEPIAESATAEAPKQAPKKQRRFGWFMALLIIAATVGAYYWYSTQLVDIKQSSQDIEEELSTITVNPNLEEELGSSWSNESKTQAPQAAKKEETAVPLKEQTPTSTIVESTEPKEVKSATPVPTKEDNAPASKPATTPPSTSGTKFCAVTLTEALSTKEIKDITLADTTDYVIASTLTTHKLRNGETIILLAKKYYGDKRLWPYIVKYNKLKDFNNVAIGQVINIPILQEKEIK